MIETELKYRLSELEFNQLHADLNFQATPTFIQTNTYYDTPTQQLKAIQAALRLRQYGTTSEWTIKQAHDQYRALELTQCGTTIAVPQKITADIIVQADLQAFLGRHQIALADLAPFASFVTKRWQQTTTLGTYVLDITLYGDQIDYELELETTTLVNAQQALQAQFKRLGIPLRPSAKKIARVAHYFAQQQGK